MIIGSNPHTYANKLLDFVVCYSRIYKIVKIMKTESTFVIENSSKSEITDVNLTELMNKYGSDKGTYH